MYTIDIYSDGKKVLDHMGREERKHVLFFFDKVRLKPACSAAETSEKLEISLVASLDMILFNKRIKKVLIRLHMCAGWSAALLFANHQRQVF